MESSEENCHKASVNESWICFDFGIMSEYTLFLNGWNLSILLFTYKLALVASFKGKYSFEFWVSEWGNKG